MSSSYKLNQKQKARKVLLQKLRRERNRGNLSGEPLAVGELRQLLGPTKRCVTKEKKKARKAPCENNVMNDLQCSNAQNNPGEKIVTSQLLNSSQQQTHSSVTTLATENHSENLETYLSQVFEEAQLTNTFDRKCNPKSQRSSLLEKWHTDKEAVLDVYTTSVICANSSCGNQPCKEQLTSIYVSCTDGCYSNHCLECDIVIHSLKPFHKRTYVNQTEFRPLLPQEIVSLNSLQVETTFIPVPLRCNKTCSSCGSRMTMTASPAVIAVVTRDGRFDLNAVKFNCVRCNSSLDADLQDYLSSGFWPGTPKGPFSYVFCTKLLAFWNHLMFLTPGTSEQMFLESVREMAEDSGRSKVIDSAQFQAASRSFRWAQQSLEERFKLADHTRCRACLKDGRLCLKGIHVDGNHKLVRRLNKREHPCKGFFEGKIIAPEEEFENFKEEIDKKKAPTSFYAGRCGSSQFQAAKEASKRFKTLDETGIVMGSCAHGTVLAAVNMHAGETYKHTLYIHLKAHREFGIEFFINDVVCLYWPWAVSIGTLIPEYAAVTHQTKPFLSYVHGQAHDINCRVEYFGHWKEGATAMVGEEQEQVFSNFSRYYNVTHKMSKSARNEHLSAAMLYWNKRKETRLPCLITRRLLTASYRVSFYSEKLNILTNNQLQEHDLLRIKEEVITEAKLFKQRSNTSSAELTRIQAKLESLYFKYVNCADELKSLSVSSKMRKSFMRKKSTIKDQARKLIDELNETDGYDLTEEDYFQGNFPWETLLNKGSFKERYNLVDCWMFLKRNQEQLEQSNREMVQYQQSLIQDIEKLKTRKLELSCGNEDANEKTRQNALLYLCSLQIRKLQKQLAQTLQFARFFDRQGIEALSYLELFSDESDSEIGEEDE